MLKDVKKGDSVILKGFTGIKLGVFEVEKVTDKTVIILKKDGTKMVFSKKTGKQTNVEEGKERYANSIMEDDGSYVAPQRKKKSTKKAASKKSKKTKEEPEEVDDEDELDEDEEVEEKPKKKSTKKSKKAIKKAKPVEEDEDEFDDFDDFEEA